MRKFLLLVGLVVSPASWAEGKTLSLEQAYGAALEKNEAVQQSSERVTQADARVMQSWGRFLPDLSASALHLIQPEPADLVARQFSPSQQTTITLTAVQPIFKGMREYAGIRQQRQQREARAAQYQFAQARLFQDVAAQYLQVLGAERDVRNLADQVEIYERRVEELKGRAQRGESSATESLSAQASYNSLRAELKLADGQLKTAREALSSLTGQPRDVVLMDPELLPESVGLSELEHYLGRIEQRGDIRAAIADAETADAGILYAAGGYFPTLDVVGNYYAMRPGFFSDLRWDVSLRFTVPIFSGGTSFSETREALSRNREAQLELARVRRAADQEVRALHESLRSRLEHLSLLKQSVDLAQKNVDVSQSDYRRGLTRNIDVQMALSEYRTLKRSLDQAHFATQNDRIKLEVAAAMKPISALSGGGKQ